MHLPGERTVKKILLATDGTQHAEKALENSISLAKQNRGRLIITYYADPNDQEIFGEKGCPDASLWHQRGKEVLTSLEKQVRAEGVQEVMTVLEPCFSEDYLGKLAQQLDVDIIVLASHLFKVG
jgi:nucleotide-binding universal stress UspA family protein